MRCQARAGISVDAVGRKEGAAWWRFRISGKRFWREGKQFSHKDPAATIGFLHGKKAVCPLQTQKMTVGPAAVKRRESLVDAS
jgi:hypothetical protein